MIQITEVHCAKSVRIFRIQTKCAKIRTRKTPNMDTFSGAEWWSQKVVLEFFKKVKFRHATWSPKKRWIKWIFSEQLYDRTPVCDRFQNDYNHQPVIITNERWIAQLRCLRNHSFNTYAKLAEMLTFFTTWYAQVHVCISGWEILAY